MHISVLNSCLQKATTKTTTTKSKQKTETKIKTQKEQKTKTKNKNIRYRFYCNPSSNNKTLNARLLARVITGCHYT